MNLWCRHCFAAVAFRMEKREFTDSIRILRIKRKECQPFERNMGRVVPAGHWMVTDCMDMIPFMGKDSGCSGEMRKAKRKVM